MYVVPYPFQCVVVYDDAQDEAIITDECDGNSIQTSDTNLAKLLFLNFTPSIMAKRVLRQKLRVLSERQTPIMLPFTRTEKTFVGPKFLGWKWRIIPIFPSLGTTNSSASTLTALFAFRPAATNLVCCCG